MTKEDVERLLWCAQKESIGAGPATLAELCQWALEKANVAQACIEMENRILKLEHEKQRLFVKYTKAVQHGTEEESLKWAAEAKVQTLESQLEAMTRRGTNMREIAKKAEKERDEWKERWHNFALDGEMLCSSCEKPIITDNKPEPELKSMTVKEWIFGNQDKGDYE